MLEIKSRHLTWGGPKTAQQGIIPKFYSNIEYFRTKEINHAVVKTENHTIWICTIQGSLVEKGIITPTNTCTTIDMKWYSKFNLYILIFTTNECHASHIGIIWNLASRRFLIDDSSNNRGPQVQIGLYNAISQKSIDIQIFLVV